MKSGIYVFENPKRKRSWVDRRSEPPTSTTRSNRYGGKTMFCVWWDQKGVIYYELLKTWVHTATTNDRFESSFTWKTTRISKKATTKQFCFMIMHHHIQQNRSRKRLKSSVGKYFRTRLTHQTWPRRLLFICIDGARTFWPAFHFLRNVRKWLDDWFASKER